MTRDIRTMLLGLTPALFLGVSAPALAASAADTAAGDAAADADQGLTDIIVTAEKRPETLQKTPISISVLKTDDLMNRHVQSLLDLGDGAIPSLRVAPFFSRQSALIINVRGIGVLSDSNQPARDQGVGVYIDGVYLGRAQGLGTAIYDVENIEVLKGPQGTLFGRNTEGGAVNIVTKRPSGEFKLNATGGLGNFGSHKGEIHLDLPEFANLSVKLDGIITARNGFVKNPLSGAHDFGEQNKRGFHGEVMWKPIDTFTADYAFDTSYDASTSLYQQLLAAPTGAPATATASAVLPNVLPALARIQATRARTAVVGSPEQPSVGRTHGHRLNLEWQVIPEVMLKSITSYREMTQSQYDNGSAATGLGAAPAQLTPTAACPTGGFACIKFSRYSLAQFRQNQFSQELQAVGEAGRVKFAVGALYYQERVTDNAQAFNTNQYTDAAGSAYTILPLDPAVQPIDRASHVKTTSMGVYGQATFTPALLDEAAHLTVGARYTHDKKEGSLFIVNNALPVLPVNGVNVSAPILLNKAWSRVDPLVNLAFDVSHDVHVYGKWSTGYKSGGANSRSTSYAGFNPEKVSMFEIGAKTEFWDHKARFNIAGYVGTYKDIQLDFSGLYEDVVNGVPVITTRTTTNTVNAPGTGRLKGVEAELTLAPIAGLTLNASYAYNSVKIPNTTNPFPQTGSNGKPLPFALPIYQVYTPEHSASGAIDYEAPMDGYKLRFHVDANYDSGYYGNYTDPLIDAAAGNVRLKQPKGDSGFVVNGRIAIADIDMGVSGAKVTVSAWARNLFNEQHVFLKSLSAPAGLMGFFNDPRTFGGELNVKF